jgi:molybdopterin-synthase adenylyltransferase
MTLSPDEIQRYKRHLLLREIGGAGQQSLKASRVMIIGAGGLGAPVLLYLAAAGVGILGVIDDDRVSLDNLQRQVVHDTPGVGQLKVESAAATVARLNPHVRVETFARRLDAANAADLIASFDIVVDGSDNFSTRYLVADTCAMVGRTLVSAAVGPFDGQLTTLKPHLTGADGRPNPSYRCLFPEPPPAGTVANCEENGVLGSVVGVMGTLAATEVLKEITGAGTSLVGRLLLYDALDARFTELRYSRVETSMADANPYRRPSDWD